MTRAEARKELQQANAKYSRIQDSIARKTKEIAKLVVERNEIDRKRQELKVIAEYN